MSDKVGQRFFKMLYLRTQKGKLPLLERSKTKLHLTFNIYGTLHFTTDQNH